LEFEPVTAKTANCNRYRRKLYKFIFCIAGYPPYPPGPGGDIGFNSGPPPGYQYPPVPIPVGPNNLPITNQPMGGDMGGRTQSHFLMSLSFTIYDCECRKTGKLKAI
jgi:hypothetical protein